MLTLRLKHITSFTANCPSVLVIQYSIVTLSMLKILNEDFMRSYSLYFTKKNFGFELGKMDFRDFSDPAALQGYKFMLVINCCKL